MANGILDEWLQDELWYQRVADGRIDGPLYAKSIRKPYLLDGEVLLDETQLLTQRHLMPLLSLQHLTQDGT